MGTALTFNEISFTPVTHQNSLWIRAVELAHALGYKRPDILTKLYTQNADEFTPDMTQVIEIVDNTESVFPVKARIFSLRGCHLLAMFARTPVAKAFRKWVLDVLDRLAAEERAALPSSDTLTPEQQAHLQAIVAAKAGMVPASHRRRAFQEIWARFNNNFQIARYAQLPPARIGEAVEYLVSMEVKAAKALPPSPGSNLQQSRPTPAPIWNRAADLTTIPPEVANLPDTRRLFKDIQRAADCLAPSENWTHMAVRFELGAEASRAASHAVDLHVNAAWYALGMARSSLLAAVAVGKLGR